MKIFLLLGLLVLAGCTVQVQELGRTDVVINPDKVFTDKEITDVKQTITMTPVREMVLESVLKGENPKRTDFNANIQDVKWAYEDLLEILGDDDNKDFDNKTVEELNVRIIEFSRKAL